MCMYDSPVVHAQLAVRRCAGLCTHCMYDTYTFRILLSTLINSGSLGIILDPLDILNLSLRGPQTNKVTKP